MGRSYKSYEVGYGKPPLSGRFKPGQSGNKSGRPKKRTSLFQHFEGELNRRHVVNENGEPRSLTTIQIVVKQLIAQAAKGHAKPLAFLIDVLEEIDLSSKKSEATRSVRSLTKDDIAKMTDEERTDAYMRLINLSRSD